MNNLMGRVTSVVYSGGRYPGHFAIDNLVGVPRALTFKTMIRSRVITASYYLLHHFIRATSSLLGI